MRKKRFIRAGHCYHIFSRIANRAFFLDEEEKDRFVDLLFRAAAFSCVELIGFCIMTNHIHVYIYLPEEREIPEEEILMRIHTLYRGARLNEALEEWDKLKAEDDTLRAQPGGKAFGSDFDGLKLAYRRRMFSPSEFMKTLKQHFTMSFNGRRDHTGTLWESRFGCRESERKTVDMSSILAYIDCNPVEGGICAWPTGYRWCGWTMAMNGDAAVRKMYEFVYGDAANDWNGIVALHEKAIRKRIGEIEEERRNEKRLGATRIAPVGVEPAAIPERHAIQLERGRSVVAENILKALQDGEKSAAEIGEFIGMKSRVRLLSAYIKPMLAMKLIEQTLPDSPRAPNQRYRVAS